MRPIITFPDAQLLTRDLLRQQLPLFPEADGATVDTRDPSKAPEAGRPYVRVSLEASSRDARLDGTATLRVAVWHESEGDALALASLIEGVLLATSTPEVRGFSPETSPLPAPDPDTGEPMAAFTVVARPRPVQLIPEE